MTHKRDLSFEVALGKVAGLKPEAVHFQMVRLLKELIKGRRLTVDENRKLYHSIYFSASYERNRRELANVSVARPTIQYNTDMLYYNVITHGEDEGD